MSGSSEGPIQFNQHHSWDLPEPDQDLIDDLVKTVNRHGDRLNMGSVFASLMVVASTAIHSGMGGRMPDRRALWGLCQFAVGFLAKPHKPANPKTVIHR